MLAHTLSWPFEHLVAIGCKNTWFQAYVTNLWTRPFHLPHPHNKPCWDRLARLWQWQQPSKLASCCVMLCDHMTQCVKIVPFASCCVFTQSVMLSGVVLSRSASYYAVVRDHTLVRNVWCCAIAQCVVLCRVVLSRSASTCVVLLYHALRRIVYCRAITQCVVLCGVTLSRSASYCVGSCYHAMRRIVWRDPFAPCTPT